MKKVTLFWVLVAAVLFAVPAQAFQWNWAQHEMSFFDQKGKAAKLMQLEPVEMNVLAMSPAKAPRRALQTYTWSFNQAMNGFTTIDADGDGNTWYYENSSQTTDHQGGKGMMTSASYISSGALTPDNYLVSPKIKLDGTLTFYASAQDASYPSEHFCVSVSTAGNTAAADFTQISDEWVMTKAPRRTQGAWYEYTVDLSSYAGAEGYVAIRHFNCTDWFRINVDDITITTSEMLGEYDPTLEEAVAGPTLVVLPEGVEETATEYVMTYTANGEQATKPIMVAVDGNDVYFKGMSQYIPSSWVKGVKDGNNVTFAADQYMGEYGSYGESYFFYNGAVTFVYDAVEDTYSAEGQVFGVLGGQYYDGNYIDPVLKKVTEIAATPATPEITNVASGGYGYYMQFNVPTLDTDGNGLVTSKLSYQIFVDVQREVTPLTFTPATHIKLTEDMSVIPYDFTDDYDISNTYIYFNELFSEDWNKIGIQSIYTGGGEEHKSEIFWYTLQEYKFFIMGTATAGGWDATTEMPLNAETEAYEYNLTAPADGAWICFGDAAFTNWDDFNNVHRYSLAATGNVEPTLGEAQQLVLGGGDACVYLQFGNYDLSVSKDLKLTVTKNPELVALPDGAEVQTWYAEGVALNSNVPNMAKIAFVGNDVYVNAFFAGIPDAWIKGTLDGSTVTFAAGQYVGKNEANQNIWISGIVESGESGELVDLKMSYDATAQVLTLVEEQDIAINTSATELALIDYVGELTIKKDAPAPKRVELPYTNNFASALEQADFDIIDANADGKTWNFQNEAGVYSYSSSAAADDWLVAPQMMLKAGTTYHISLKAKARAANYPEKFEVKAAKEATTFGNDALALLTAGVNVIAATEINNTDFETFENKTFTVAEDGYYNIGIHAISAADRWSLTIDDFTVEEVLYWTVAGTPAVLFGEEWNPALEANDMVLGEDGKYTWTKNEIDLTAGDVEFKVVKNHSWANEAYPSENYKLTIEKASKYNVSITFDAETKDITVDLEDLNPVLEYTVTFTTDRGWEKVYAYAWSGEGESTIELLGTWPGTEMTPADGIDNGYGITFSTSIAPEKIIFSNGVDQQTADLDFVDGQTYEYNYFTPVFPDGTYYVMNASTGKLASALTDAHLDKVGTPLTFTFDAETGTYSVTGISLLEGKQVIAEGDTYYTFSFIQGGLKMYAAVNAAEEFTLTPNAEDVGATWVLLAPEYWEDVALRYNVAGTADLCGTAWDTNANTMTKNTETGLYEWTATGIAVSETIKPEFKVAINNVADEVELAGWIPTGEANWIITLGALGEEGVPAEEGLFNITITFNAATKIIAVAGERTGDLPVPAEDITVKLEEACDIAAAVNAAMEDKNVGSVTIELTKDVAYTFNSTIEVPGALTVWGNDAVIDASALSGNMFQWVALVEPTEWTKADVEIAGVTVNGLKKALFYSNSKNYVAENFTVNWVNVEQAGDATTFDFTKGSTAVNFNVTNSTFYAPTATTKSFYSSQGGQKTTEYKEDATQTFKFEKNTMYNLAPGKNFFSHRQSNQKWLAYDVQENIFVNCGKSGQVIKGMNGGQSGANPTWIVKGNAFNFDNAETSVREDTSTAESTGDDDEPIQDSVAGVVTFTDAANGDFNGTFELADGATAPEALGAPKWTITFVEYVEPKLYIMGNGTTGGWNTTTEMTFNETTQTFEYDITATGDTYFTFGDAEFTNWDDWNANNRLAIAAGDQPVEMGAEYQLIKVNGTIMVTATGTLHVSVTQDLKMTITLTTGIDGVNVAALKDAQIYNLKGQRLDKTQKGLNIINGRKVVIK